MQRHARLGATALGLMASFYLVGCGDTSPSAGDAGASDGGATVPADGALPERFNTPMTPAFGSMTNDPRAILVTVSGEAAATEGFAYSATPAEGDLVFVDGWQVNMTRVLTVIGNVRLNRPGNMPSDPSVVGAAVAADPRSFAVNLTRPGPIEGAGGEGSAWPLVAFRNGVNGLTLDPAQRYAFSYDVIAATAAAENVNLDADDVALYRTMITRGWSVYAEGTATYRGQAPEATSAFASFPTTVRWQVAYGAPAAYLNCNNPDNGAEGAPGVQPSANGAYRAQITFHLEHWFWGALQVEDPPLHFDPFAARAAVTGAQGEVTLDALQGVVPSNLQDRMMRPLGDRGGQTRGYTVRNPAALSFDTGGVSSVRDLRDFVAFSGRANAHLNGEGLCFVRPMGELRF